jgi:hypothetical protein
MEDQKTSAKSIILNYGLIYGVISILFHVILYIMGKHLEQNWITSLFGFVLMTVVIVLGVKKFKSFNNGLLSIGQAIKTAIGVVVFGALVYAIYNYVFMTFVEPDTMEQALELGRQKMIEADMSDDIIERSLEMQRKFSGPGIIGASVIIINAIFGLIVSLVVGLVMKKEESYI